MKKILFFILGLFLGMKDSFAEIVTSTSLEEMIGALEELQEGDLVLVDVDDTLMTPVSKVFHDQNRRGLHFIDELKSEKIPNLPEILGTWRLTRKVQLVNKLWPVVLTKLRERGVWVFGLTQMETGPCGPIPSMEEWRFQELKQYGFTFTQSIGGRSSFRLKENPKGQYAAFYNGIIMTGPFLKGEILEAFLTETKLAPKQIVFFDDRRPHVEDVQKVAMKRDILFLGIHFKENDKMLSRPDPRVVALQKDVLIKKKTWLEDEEAEKYIQQSSITEGQVSRVE